MSDLFHDSVPDDYIARVWAVMAMAPRHTFQVLTKRHARMRSLLNGEAFREQVVWAATGLSPYVTADDIDWPLPNVWLGVSTENQQWAEIRIPALLDTPAAVRWISAEPLLGPIDLHTDPIEPGTPFWGSRLDWVVTGGESGHGARPMHPHWARSLRDQCTTAGVPFYFKQWGEWIGVLTDQHRGFWEPQAWVNKTTGAVADDDTAAAAGGDWTGVWRVGKRASGRQLDGETWDQYPEAVTR